MAYKDNFKTRTIIASIANVALISIIIVFYIFGKIECKDEIIRSFYDKELIFNSILSLISLMFLLGLTIYLLVTINKEANYKINLILTFVSIGLALSSGLSYCFLPLIFKDIDKITTSGFAYIFCFLAISLMNTLYFLWLRYHHMIVLRYGSFSDNKDEESIFK